MPGASIRKTDVKDQRNTGKKTLISLASAFAILTFVTAALGFGISLSMHGFMGLPNASLFKTTLDLIGLSAYAVMGIPSTMHKAAGPLSGEVIFGALLIASIGLCMAWAIAIHLHHKRLALRVAFARQKKGASFWRIGLPGRKASAADVARSYLQPVTFVGGAALVSYIAIRFLIPTIFLLLILIPWMGYKQGNIYIRDYVIGPESCQPILSRERWLATFQAQDDTGKDGADNTHKPKTAMCVRITQGGTATEGRVIFASSAATALYDPKTGKSFLVPTEGARVESIDELH